MYGQAPNWYPQQPAPATSVEGSDDLYTHGVANQPQITAVQIARMRHYMAYQETGGYPGYEGAGLNKEDLLDSVQRCHLHTKPNLNCKFCRKYKSAVHEMSRIAEQQPSSEEKVNALPMTNTSTYNLNTLLRNNILASDYYKSLTSMQTFQQVVDELVQYAEHAEPYCATAVRVPSTLFCCLHRFFTMRLTEKQMTQLLEHPKSPYVRCCGLLYLRFVLPSDKLWEWFEPYLLDDEEFVASASKRGNAVPITIGEFAANLLLEDKYANTILPRLPTKFRNKYGPILLQMPRHRKRRAMNMERLHAFQVGSKVLAYKDGNWQEAEIVDIDEEGNNGYPIFTVTFNDDENTKTCLDVAYLSLSSDEPHKSDVKRRRNDESDDEYDAEYKRFKQREQQRATAHGKDYGRRPTCFKTSLSRSGLGT